MALGLLLLFVLALAYLVGLRAPRLFSGSFEGGRFRLTGGRSPGRLCDELGDIARLEGLDQVRLDVRSVAGRPNIEVSGPISEGQLQQLRNVVYRFEVSQIRAGKRRAARS